jgi:hypothetical protein
MDFTPPHPKTEIVPDNVRKGLGLIFLMFFLVGQNGFDCGKRNSSSRAAQTAELVF